jgi:hypothetical protein
MASQRKIRQRRHSLNQRSLIRINVLSVYNLVDNAKIVTGVVLSDERAQPLFRSIFSKSTGDSNMIQGSKLAASAIGTAVVILLAACATTSPASKSNVTQVAVKAQSKGNGDEGETITGSRIPRKTTDQIVTRVDAVEMERERPPNPGPKFN